MKRIMFAAVAMLVLASPALANRHRAADARPIIIDVGAVPAYPIVKSERYARPAHRRASRPAADRPKKQAKVATIPLPRARPLPADPSRDVFFTAADLRGEAPVTTVVYPKTHPYRMTGILEIDGRAVRFSSGGDGRGAIPYGSYPITPSAIGPWGARHGAIGINGNKIWDQHVRDWRRGIEFHAAGWGTAGCVGIAYNEWRAFKKKLLAMIDVSGQAWLHVHPKAVAITPHKQWSPEQTKVAKVIEHHGPSARRARYANHRHYRQRLARG